MIITPDLINSIIIIVAAITGGGVYGAKKIKQRRNGGSGASTEPTATITTKEHSIMCIDNLAPIKAEVATIKENITGLRQSVNDTKSNTDLILKHLLAAKGS